MRINALTFKTLNGLQYIFDNNKGVVIPFSDEMSYILDNYDCSTREDLISNLKSSNNYSEDYLYSVYDYIALLLKKGMFCFDENSTLANRALSYDDIYNNSTSQLILIVTESCNMRCKYCVYSDHYPGLKSYSEKEMSEKTALKAVDFYIDIHKQKMEHGIYKEPTISFYGGEPFLKFDLIKKVIEYCKSKNFKASFNMTTNGTIISDEMIDFIIANKIVLTFSLDGPEDNHDRNRVLQDNTPTFDCVFENLKKLQFAKKKHNVKIPLSINVTFDMNTDMEKVVEFFNDNYELLSPYALNFNEVVKYGTTYYEGCDLKNSILNKSLSSLTNKFLGMFNQSAEIPYALKTLFIPVKQINLRQRFNKEQYNVCLPGGKFAISPDEKIYVCEKVTQSCAIGNLETGISLEKMNNLYSKYTEIINENCKYCPVSRLCNMCYAQMVKDNHLEFSEEACKSSLDSIKNSLTLAYTLLENNERRFKDTFGNS